MTTAAAEKLYLAQHLVEWEGKGSHRFVITKPVRYVVQEIGAGLVPAMHDTVSVKNGGPATAEELAEADNPDSGPARYV